MQSKKMGKGPLLRIGDIVRIKCRRQCLCCWAEAERKMMLERMTVFEGGLCQIIALEPQYRSSVRVERLDEFGVVDAEESVRPSFDYGNVLPVGYDGSLSGFVHEPAPPRKTCPKCGKRIDGVEIWFPSCTPEYKTLYGSLDDDPVKDPFR